MLVDLRGWDGAACAPSWLPARSTRPTGISGSLRAWRRTRAMSARPMSSCRRSCSPRWMCKHAQSWLGAGAVPPGTCCQTPRCNLVKRPRPRGLPDWIYCTGNTRANGARPRYNRALRAERKRNLTTAGGAAADLPRCNRCFEFRKHRVAADRPIAKGPKPGRASLVGPIGYR